MPRNFEQDAEEWFGRGIGQKSVFVVSQSRQDNYRLNMCRSCYNYMVAIEMAEASQVLGKVYERFLRHADTLDCEQEFRQLSRCFIKKDLFSHRAFFLRSLTSS